MHQNIPRQLDDAVAEVFDLMLALECSPLHEAHGADDDVFPAGRHSASVLFSGGLDGSCALQADPLAAARLTEQLTGIPSDCLDPKLFEDTIAELCNMIAGSWKSRQPGALACSTLSPPVQVLVPRIRLPYTFVRTYIFSKHLLTLELSLR